MEEKKKEKRSQVLTTKQDIWTRTPKPVINNVKEGETKRRKAERVEK